MALRAIGRATRTAGAAILTLAVLPMPAMADDPRDPTMKNPAAIARDREMIRKLNRDMLEQVNKRDREYASGWTAYRQAKNGGGDYDRQMSDYQRDRDTYAESRRRYEQAMLDWRRDVSACRAGDYSACN